MHHAAAKPSLINGPRRTAVVPIGGVISAGSHIVATDRATFRAADIFSWQPSWSLTKPCGQPCPNLSSSVITQTIDLAVRVIAGVAHIVVSGSSRPIPCSLAAEALLIVAETANCEEAARGALPTASNRMLFGWPPRSC